MGSSRGHQQTPVMSDREITKPLSPVKNERLRDKANENQPILLLFGPRTAALAS